MNYLHWWYCIIWKWYICFLMTAGSVIFPRMTRWCTASTIGCMGNESGDSNILVHKGVVDGPDKQHEARCSPKRDNEGAEDRQSQEVRKDSVTALSAWTLAQSGCQVAWFGISQRYTPAIVKHLTKKKTMFINDEWAAAHLCRHQWYYNISKNCCMTEWNTVIKPENYAVVVSQTWMCHEVSGVGLTVFLPEPVEEVHPAKHGDM